jgi:gamma-D-glutamyl-L-lysine dipeptidyl-peptidase
MDFGISLQSILPLYAEPSQKSEMVSQLLFGEMFRVKENNGKWLRIQLSYDDYEGWAELKQITLIDEQEFIRLLGLETPASLDLVQLLSNETRKSILPVLLGSSLPGLTNQHFRIKDQIFSYEGLVAAKNPLESAVSPQERLSSKQKVIDDAMLYLNAPYLWGGRSPFGIDCSGFTQMVFRLNQVKILRDASQQAKLGEPLNFISETEPGDLAFFDDEEGNIIHVGLLMDKSHIIHASGKVRIDPIDHQGIYSQEEKKYTHKLRVIRRII